jgi:hypothetical protein
VISGGLLALSMVYGLTQREFRDFGTGGSEPSPNRMTGRSGNN